MYLPKFRQIVGGKIPGKLIDPKTGLNYLGAFVQDFKGNFFKGDSITSKSKPLEFIPDEEIAKQALGFENIYVSPSSDDVRNGYMFRYFVKDLRSGKIVEVDKEVYSAQRKQNKLYRRTLKIQWYIVGNFEDETINGYIYPGIKSKNLDVIDQAETALPGITAQHLKDPAQFVRK